MPPKAKKVPVRKAQPARGATDVESFLDALAHPRRALIDALRRVIARAVPAATEDIKWNAPSFALREHFATLQLRTKTGVQLVLHLGAKPRPGIDMRDLVPASQLLEWKGGDRAIVTIRDAAHLRASRAELTVLLGEWSTQLA